MLTAFFEVDSTEMASTTITWMGYVWESVDVFVYVIMAVVLSAFVLKVVLGAFNK